MLNMFKKSDVRKVLISLALCLLVLPSFAQIPSFHRTAGDKTMYSFVIVDWNPEVQAMSSTSSFQWGIGDHFATGLTFSNSLLTQNMALIARAGVKVNRYFGIGGMLTPWFNLNNGMEYSHFSGWLAINGDITDKLSYCSNTGFSARDKISGYQLSYLGYTIGLNENWSLTPMVGASFSLAFDEPLLPTAGLFLAYKEWGFYVWGRQLANGDPSIEFSIEFRLR